MYVIHYYMATYSLLLVNTYIQTNEENINILQQTISYIVVQNVF